MALDGARSVMAMSVPLLSSRAAAANHVWAVLVRMAALNLSA